MFFELLELTKQNGEIIYWENYNRVHMDMPDKFEAQLGTFDNHNQGEFGGFLSIGDYPGLPQNEREIHLLSGRGDFFLYGNYCDMFDC